MRKRVIYKSLEVTADEEKGDKGLRVTGDEEKRNKEKEG